MCENNNEVTLNNTGDTCSIKYSKYFKFLIKNFGHVNLRGCAQLAQIIELYDITKPELLKCYKAVAEKEDTTVTAVERNIRTYIDCITETYTIAELSSTLNYTFKPGTERLTASDLLPALKMYIDEI